MLASYRKPLPSLPTRDHDFENDSESSSSVLPSSTELFYYYRETLERCAKLSTKGPFLDLCKVYKKWLRVYAEEVLGGSLMFSGRTDPRRSSSSDGRLSLRDIGNACLVLNTADYCSETTTQVRLAILA